MEIQTGLAQIKKPYRETHKTISFQVKTKNKK